MNIVENTDPKIGKKRESSVSHKSRIKATYEAHRLEGAVAKRGVQNVGHQAKKKKFGKA
jgi:hypothetical protein